MFVWQKEMRHLDIPAARVLHLRRSLGDVQVALPGLPSQQTTAYLAAFSENKGVRIAIALYLHRSAKVAIYLNEGGALEKAEAGAALKAGVRFAESMGFMMDDLHLQRLSASEREALWDELPLRREKGQTGATSPPARSGEDIGARRRRFLKHVGRFMASQ
ncbi:MAG: hypothetical protein C0617_09680 [Desulfuromonas sp.]|uniref:hypothetical protein n=1 Tax=Desulfuromonas sp. TaxID=892 RepID=UPI000CB24FF2|nr:hypothetical protein [Desulfuromonas sp.]PLX83988.1 MAG: hypothetical protein C0617_09680 [Desulfuromonas sp.]